MIDIQKEYEADLKALFQKYESLSPMLKRGFAVPKVVHHSDILFLGLNPSFVRDEEPAEPEYQFYDLELTGNYIYFRPFERMAKCIGSSWTHLDLLGLRETNQPNVQALIRSPEGLAFIWEHLQLSKILLERTRCSVVVVTNTLARTFLGKDATDGEKIWLGHQFKFDPDLGTYRFDSKESALYKKPVFFTGMLSGRRSIDRGSRERLTWHVAKGLNKKLDSATFKCIE